MAGTKGRSGGRNRRPPTDHQLRGTYRADRHGPLPPPEPPVDPITKSEPSIPIPRDIQGAARRHWKYFAPLLQSARVLTPADVQLLSDFCRCCASVEDRDRRLTTLMRKRQIDWQLQGRLDRELRGWVERKMKIAIELGLTPVSRTRVAWTGHPQGASAPSAAKPQSKLAQLQERAAALRRPVGVK